MRLICPPLDAMALGKNRLVATGLAPRRVLARRWASCSLRSAVHVVVRPTGWAMALTLLLTSHIAAAPVTLAWDASVSMVDGYWLYYGTQSGTYTARIDVGPATTCALADLTSGQTYCFAVTQYDRIDGTESAFSNEVSTTLPPNQPSPVGGGQPLSSGQPPGRGQTPSGGGGGGCAINPGAGFDPMVMGITTLWLASLIWKCARKPWPGL